MFPLRARLALGLTLIGIATIAVGWYASRSSESLSEQWTPVNSQVAQTLDSLNSKAPIQPINEPQDQQPTSTTVPSKIESPVSVTKPESEPVPSTSPSQASETRLNLNAATLEQLENLPGIGPSKAKAIIAYREQHGGYRTIDELLDVKGIGRKMLEKLQPEVYVP